MASQRVAPVKVKRQMTLENRDEYRQATSLIGEWCVIGK